MLVQSTNVLQLVTSERNMCVCAVLLLTVARVIWPTVRCD
jgi:hypothetical protein